ncbi:MAG: MFS transporter [Betaproteobacteria bacterium]|nr:MFS transporter [Betaproteobacteria bacterium]NBY33448.1 MFS transporter [Betaproteobacteria bacterium]
MSASPKLSRSWLHVSLKFLPFADAATDTLPLSRLLRLSLFQISVGMALAMLIGTLNRVMIVELKVPAALVAVMIALPLLFAPFRALIGFRSDHHRSALGWRRVPFIWMGTLLQFGGFAIMPFALLVLGRMGQAAHAPDWVGHLGAGMAFLLVGAGMHTTQTAGLALATDLSPPESRPKVVGLMYFMLLVGMILSSLIFGVLLRDFSPGALIRSIQGAAVLTLVLNITALWKQEARTQRLGNPHEADVDFVAALKLFTQGEQALRRLLAVGLGTVAFSMGDVLLEPFGGEILHLAVSDTTLLTALLAFGGLTGFALASNVLGRGADPFRMACGGVLVGVPAFTAVLMSAPQASLLLFSLGTLFIGFGAGLFGHGTLTATMNHAPPGQAGLALGAWGAVQATAAGLAMGLGGIIRDLMALVVDSGTAYAFVYSLEVVLLLITLYAMYPLIAKKVR